MTAISEKKQKIEDFLISSPDIIVDMRKKVLEVCLLAQEMRDSTAIKPTFNPTSGNPTYIICENYRDDQAVLLGYTSFANMISVVTDFIWNSTYDINVAAYVDELMKFTLNPAGYNDDVDFTLPTTTTVGYTVYDLDGALVGVDGSISTTPSDDNYYEKLYLIKDSSSELVDSQNSTATTAPSINSNTVILEADYKSSADSLTLESDFGESTIKLDANNIKPIFQSSGSTIDIYFSWNAGANELKIGEVDEIGNITNFGGWSYIDVDNSEINYNSQTITLILAREADNDNVFVELRYASDSSDYTTVYDEQYSAFDSTTGLFSKTLTNAGSQGPVLSTVKINFNGEQVGMINDEGELFGLKFNPSSYYNSPDNIGVSLIGITTQYNNVVSFQYVKKNFVDVTDAIGFINKTSVTYSKTLASPVSLDSLEVYLGSSKILDISDFTITWTGSVPSLALTTNPTSVYALPDSKVAHVTACTCTQAGAFTITITNGTGDYIYPVTGGDVSVVFDVAERYSTWSASFDYNTITGVDNTTNPVLKTLTMSAVATAPELLKSYVIKKYSDHTVYGYLKVLAEGLEVNTTWNPLTGSPEDCTTVNHTTFGTYLDWLQPSGSDDLMISANSDNYSFASIDSAYAEVEDSPFYPATNGTHSSPTELFASNYVGVMQDPSGATTDYLYQWSVRTKDKFEYKRSPRITVAAVDGAVTEVYRPMPLNYLNTTIQDLFNGIGLDLLSAFILELVTGFAGDDPVDPGTLSGDFSYIYTVELVNDTPSNTKAVKYYRLFRDDGLGGASVEISAANSAFNTMTSSANYKALMNQIAYIEQNGGTVPAAYKAVLEFDVYRALFPYTRVVTTIPLADAGPPDAYGTSSVGTYGVPLYTQLLLFEQDIESNKLNHLASKTGSLTGQDPCTTAGIYTMVAVSAANGYWELQKDGVRYTPGGSDCAFNELCASDEYKAVMDQMQLISDDGRDLSDIRTFYNILDHLTYRGLFPFTVPTDGATTPTFSTYATALGAAAVTFETSGRAAACAAIDTAIGTLATSGYSKDIYEAVSNAIARDINFIRDAITKYNDIEKFYDVILGEQAKWAIYNAAG